MLLPTHGHTFFLHQPQNPSDSLYWARQALTPQGEWNDLHKQIDEVVHMITALHILCVSCSMALVPLQKATLLPKQQQRELGGIGAPGVSGAQNLSYEKFTLSRQFLLPLCS